MPDFLVLNEECLGGMAELPADSVDSIVSDPPYGLSFMNKGWDHSVPGPQFWVEALRVAKPGAYIVAFGGTRTYHRLACAIEDAGWELRDCLSWLYGSGFPKSHNLKGEYAGRGTALKPAWEPIILARKPFKGTVAKNVLEHGTGALNIDGCRVEAPGGTSWGASGAPSGGDSVSAYGDGLNNAGRSPGHTLGRWPANLILDPEAGEALGAEKRFFYCAKASKGEREAGLDGFGSATVDDGRNTPIDNAYLRGKVERKNTHPTVKPIELMQWLCRLVTPPGGLVLDPFCGSGTTGCAAVKEGFDFLGYELQPEFASLARARIGHWNK